MIQRNVPFDVSGCCVSHFQKLREDLSIYAYLLDLELGMVFCGRKKGEDAQNQSGNFRPHSVAIG